MSGIKYMDPEEFKEAGFLQEANRLFFHPRGLALSMEVDDTGRATGFGGVWDYREDPEGIEFAEGIIDPAKAQRVEEEAERHDGARIAKWPHGIQPER